MDAFTRRHALTLLLVGLPASIFLYRPVHFFRTKSFLGSLYWTARSWLWNHPITPDYHIWDKGDPQEAEKLSNQYLHRWSFLRPLFAERGYYLYIRKDPMTWSSDLIPCTKSVNPGTEMSYPHARYAFTNDEELGFSTCTPQVWPARDKDGREVIIRAVSGATPTGELRALQLLHSEPLCNDPRNRTIPVLEYIEFNQQTFIVMPRWSHAHVCDFVTVGEIIRYGQAFFETVTFLHENKISHNDIVSQNMFMDVLVPGDWKRRYAGYRGLERRYALIDFGEVVVPEADGSYSPDFYEAAKRDVSLLAHSLGRYLRCIEHVIPDIVDLLSSMDQYDGQPTAATALARYEDICGRLTSEDLDLHVQAITWFQGKLIYRNGEPLYATI